MGGKPLQNEPKRGQAGRFVLLVDSSLPRPAKLLEGLRQRDAAVRIVHDAAGAMVEIAQFNAQILIVHEPLAVAELESLLAAVRTYFPKVICWRHDAARQGKREQLSPFACNISKQAQPRFAQAPEGLTRQDNASSFCQATDKTQPKNNGHSKPAISDTTSDQPAVAGKIGVAPKSAATSNGQANGQSNGVHGRPDPDDKFAQAVENHRDTEFDERSNSLGHRLAMQLDAMDDLTAEPLLSNEEIELLRGPAEDDDGPGDRHASR